jgi:hypothetical protein
MTGKKNNQQTQPSSLTEQEEEQKRQEPQERAADADGTSEANNESAQPVASTETLDDIKMPALDATGMDHTSTKLINTNIDMKDSAEIHEGGNAGMGDAMLAGGLNYVDKNSTSLAKLVKGWEAYIAEGARNVQMLQNLHLCGAGEGLARIAGPGDSFEPLGLRHTHSSPLQYSSAMMMGGGAPISLSSQVDQVRRSSSTPSTSAFRQRSANSAFGVHLRTLPHLNGPDDRSAFTLPIHRSSYAAMSDPGISYSAFEPVSTITKLAAMKLDETEKTAIEVTNVGNSEEGKDQAEDNTMTEEEKARSATLGAASRAARFLADVRFSRRRRRVRGGRENPARPSSDPSPPQETTITLQVAIVDGNDHRSEAPRILSNVDEPTSSVVGLDSCESKQEDDVADALASFPVISEDRVQTNNLLDTTASSSEHYHQLDSDIDDECEEYQRIEASIQADSPGTIPSPSYQQIIDDRPNSTDGVQDSALPTVRIQVSGAITSPRFTMDEPNSHSALVSSPNPGQMASGEGNSLTPLSQDSGRQSRSTHTTTTSGHTTLATSTSATISSGHLSAISETDREVMETNKAAKIRRRTLGSLSSMASSSSTTKNDADASVTSSSTSSTNHGYVALLGSSSATLREGANVPADRFFKHSQSISPGGFVTNGGVTTTTQSRMRTSSTSVKGGSANSPTTISSSSFAHTSSSSSSGEDPPTFVSYLDRQGASDLTSLREDVVSTERTRGDAAEERESPSEIVGYSEVIFEEADAEDEDEDDSQQPRPILRPIKERLTGRLQKFRYRPPRSPVKGSRPLATPPPGSSGDAVSPANQHLSPPRNIVENPIDRNLSRPSVVRTALGGAGPVLISPDAGSSQQSMLGSSHLSRNSNSGVDREELEMFGTQVGYVGDYSDHEGRMLEHMYTGLSGSPRDRAIGRVHTFEEGSIEIWKTDSKDEATIVKPVSPEKDVGEDV